MPPRARRLSRTTRQQFKPVEEPEPAPAPPAKKTAAKKTPTKKSGSS